MASPSNLGGGGRVLGRHPYTGTGRGVFSGPGELHEANHQGACRRCFGILPTSLDLRGGNLNPHEENHEKKEKRHLPSVSSMELDAPTFAVTLIKELQSCSINRALCDAAVRGSVKHSRHADTSCARVWFYGRCFCGTPLMKSLDGFGRLRITLLDTKSILCFVSRE